MRTTGVRFFNVHELLATYGMSDIYSRAISLVHDHVACAHTQSRSFIGSERLPVESFLRCITLMSQVMLAWKTNAVFVSREPQFSPATRPGMARCQGCSWRSIP